MRTRTRIMICISYQSNSPTTRQKAARSCVPAFDRSLTSSVDLSDQRLRLPNMRRLRDDVMDIVTRWLFGSSFLFSYIVSANRALACFARISLFLIYNKHSVLPTAHTTTLYISLAYTYSYHRPSTKGEPKAGLTTGPLNNQPYIHTWRFGFGFFFGSA